MAGQSRSFNILIAGLAHSLAAAYHIKWHESRYHRLEQKAQTVSAEGASGAVRESSAPILRLVRHRNSESIVPRIMETLKQQLGLSQMFYLYEPSQKGDTLRQWKQGLDSNIELPSRAGFAEVCRRFNRSKVKPVADLAGQNQPSSRLLRQMGEAGLRHATVFPLGPNRTGLLAWSGGSSSDQVARALAQVQPHARDLVENAESYERVEALSYTDGLTGLANQRYFHRRLKEEIGRAGRYHRSLALIIFDLDGLKTVNDRFGHLAGDAVLRRLGEILTKSIRAIDIVARYGGDEFCVIMPEADVATCRRFMERLQAKIVNSRFTVGDDQTEIRCTISQGGAVFPEHATDYEKLMHAADTALLKAKEAGRSTYLIYDPESWLETV
jgi:diguanylate cyclase (GGDEF)-like protein